MNDEQELGITESKQYNTGEWYAETVQKAGPADYGPEGMSGFIVTCPRGYTLWESIQNYFDGEFKRMGVQNAYFPLFIPESCLERGKDIVEEFDLEVAWVIRGGYKELEERLTVRLTSEFITAPYMAQQVRSHRDLLLRVNQWVSAVRREATETKSSSRTKEFFWQEGHTAHETCDGAWDETVTRLSQYQSSYEDALAIPVLRGTKPEHDKSPGVDTTMTVETLVPDSKSVQAGTSRYLDTSFAEVFDLTYTTEDEDEEPAHMTLWGLSWCSFGALIMAHSDDQGLVLPPTIASEQAVVVPIWQADTQEKVLDYTKNIAEDLGDVGVRVELDARDERNPGLEFNEWEFKGVPVRFGIGPNEVDGNVVTAVHRPDGGSAELDRENIAEAVQAQFDEVYAKFYVAAEESLEENVREASERDEILGTIGQHGGYVKTPWCGDEACEDEIKGQIAVEIVMVPLNSEDAKIHDGKNCVVCDDDAEETAYLAKSY